MTGISEGLTIVLMVIGIIAAVLWFFLPFAVFGIKDKMNQANENSTRVLGELVAIRELLQAQLDAKND